MRHLKTYEFFGPFKKKKEVKEDLTIDLVRDIIENIIDDPSIVEYLSYANVRFPSKFKGTPDFEKIGYIRKLHMIPINNDWDEEYNKRHNSFGVIAQDIHRVYKGMDEMSNYSISEIEEMLDKHRDIFDGYGINFGIYSPYTLTKFAAKEEDRIIKPDVILFYQK